MGIRQKIKKTKIHIIIIIIHIKKNKRYWMTYVDLTLEPGYKKTKNNNWSWGIRGDEKISEIRLIYIWGKRLKVERITYVAAVMLDP